MVGTRSWEDGFFIEDDWSVRPRLTLNLGLRYDILTWPIEVFNRQSNFNIATGQIDIAGAGGSSRALIPNDWLNFNPRIGFAYQATADGKTVVRGGIGLFSYLNRGGISNQLAQNPPFSGEQSFNYNQGYRITLSGQTGSPTDNNSINATQPLPLGVFPKSFSLTEPQNVAVLASLPSNRTPRVAEWNLQVERQLSPNMSMSIGYVGDHGFHEITYYNYNAQPFGLPVHGPTPAAPNDFNPCASNLTINFPCLGAVTVQSTVGTSDYNSLQMQFQRRMSAGWQLLGSFTWQKILNTTCGAFDCTQPQDYQNLALDRGYSQLDQPYVLVISSLYHLPFGRGMRWGSGWSRPLNMALGDWHVNGIYTLQAGLPFDLSVGGSANAVLRPNASCLPGTRPGNLQQYVNGGTCLSAPAAQLYPDGSIAADAPGTAARNLLFGPGLSNLDLAVSKSFAMTERARLQFRIEAYNLTNTPHFGQPNGLLGSYQDTCANGASAPCTPLFQANPFFGQITSTIPYSNREVEIGARIIF
jgi:outer membrane receptor protein involved in Fe transport